MNDRIKKTAAAFLSFALLTLSPGLESYAATAGRFASNSRAAGASPVAAVPLSLAKPPVPPSGDGANRASLDFPGLKAVSLTAGMPAAAAASPATRASAASAVAAQRQLSLGADQILSAAAPSASAEGGAATLNAVFHGRTPAAATLAIPAGPSTPAPSGLAASLRKSGGGRPQSTAPRQSLGRSARVGFLSAVTYISIHYAITFGVQTFGYRFHSDYAAAFPNAAAVAYMIMAAVLAPVSEEILFRGGRMGGIRVLTRRLLLIGRFWSPATLSSLVFVALHEMSDPVLFASRFTNSMIMSYAFHAEGITGSIFSHAFSNGLFVLMTMLMAALPPLAAGLAIIPAILALSWAAYKKTAAEAAEKKSGQLVPYEVNGKEALTLAAVLTAGYFFLVASQFWLAGALGWVIYALWRALARKIRGPQPSRGDVYSDA